MEVDELIPRRPRGAGGSFVAIAPGQDSEETGDAFSRLLGTDPYTARQLLRRASGVVLSFPTLSAANLFAEHLEDQEIMGTAYEQRNVDDIPDAAVATQLYIPADGIADPHPYRSGASPSRVQVVCGTQPPTWLGTSQIRFAALGNISTRRAVIGPSRVYRANPVERSLDRRIDRQRQIDGRRVLDLYGDFETAVRVVERITSITGLGAKHYERASGFAQLLAWLGTISPLEVASGFRSYGEQAGGAPRVLEMRESLCNARLVNENLTPDWDAWSARSWMLWSMQQR